MSREPCIRDADLLTWAQGVFGNLVTDAWYMHGSSAVREMGYTPQPTDTKGIDLNYCDVVFKFENGAVVEFNASEWARIERVEEPEVSQPAGTMRD